MVMVVAQKRAIIALETEANKTILADVTRI